MKKRDREKLASTWTFSYVAFDTGQTNRSGVAAVPFHAQTLSAKRMKADHRGHRAASDFLSYRVQSRYSRDPGTREREIKADVSKHRGEGL